MKTTCSALLCALTATVALVTLSGAARAQDAEAKQGDAAAGSKKNASCVGCHGIVGYQASFPEVHKVPKIAGQSEQYIVAALHAYKKGERKHPTMRGIAESLSEQDIADLAAYYAALGGPRPPVPDTPVIAPSPEVTALLGKVNCTICHGSNFNKPIPGYPKLAGQYADYLLAALKAYKIEHNPLVGRGNMIMAAQDRQFNNVELKALADYISSLPGDVRTVSQPEFK